VIFIEMIAKTLGCRPNILAGFTIGVWPCGIEPIFRKCLMLFLILLKFLFRHHDPTIITYNIAILNVRIDMLHYFFLSFLNKMFSNLPIQIIRST
jgi:hypothetical protein